MSEFSQTVPELVAWARKKKRLFHLAAGRQTFLSAGGRHVERRTP
ncbi:hypothetical protein [Salmonella enterica]